MSRRFLTATAAALVTLAWPVRADIHVASSVAVAAAVYKPQPEYNPLARQMKVSGDVSVELKINVSGQVESVNVVSGSAMLSGAVVRTVKTWRFKPFLQDNHPTVATTVLRFSFR